MGRQRSDSLARARLILRTADKAGIDLVTRLLDPESLKTDAATVLALQDAAGTGTIAWLGDPADHRPVALFGFERHEGPHGSNGWLMTTTFLDASIRRPFLRAMREALHAEVLERCYVWGKCRRDSLATLPLNLFGAVFTPASEDGRIVLWMLRMNPKLLRAV